MEIGTVTPKKKQQEKRIFGCRDLAAVQVHKPHVVWYFELGFVEEETGWDTNNVGSGGQKQLWQETNSS